MKVRTCSRRARIGSGMTDVTAGAMIADVREAFQQALSRVLGHDVEVSEPVLLAGGASKEAWSVDAGGERLLVRRAAVGVIHRHTLSLRHEFEGLEAAVEAGGRGPRP